MNSSWNDVLLARNAHFSPTLEGEISFASPQEEVSRAALQSILVPLTHLGLIQVEGEEAADFLHRLGSNDVKKLGTEQAQHNSLNSPKGRMLANLLIWRSKTGYKLMLSGDLRESILKKLSMYVLRAKVRLADASSSRILLGAAGPAAREALLSAGFQAPSESLGVTQGDTRIIQINPDRFIIDLPCDSAEACWDALVKTGLQPAGSAAWRWLDIQAGLPLITAATQDEFIAQMLNFELLGGVNFQKGCYPGQEIVARTQYLGKLKKRMFRAHCDTQDSNLIGTDLYAPEFGEQSCGKVVSAVISPQGGIDLLAVMQISAFEAGEVHLGTPQGPKLALGEQPYAID